LRNLENHVVREVDDPLISTAELAHQRQKRPSSLHSGKISAVVSLRTLIGGLAGYKLSEPQIRAASRFKSVYEGRDTGGVRASDFSRPYVDSSFKSANVEIERGERARRKYREIIDALGRKHVNLLESVIIKEYSLSKLAGKKRRSGYKEAIIKNNIINALNELCLFFNL